jgi:hypothetical protein
MAVVERTRAEAAPSVARWAARRAARDAAVEAEVAVGLAAGRPAEDAVHDVPVSAAAVTSAADTSARPALVTRIRASPRR